MTYRLATYHGPAERFYAIGPKGPVASFTVRQEALDWIAERNADPSTTQPVTLDTVQDVEAPQRLPLSERLAQTLRFLQGSK